MYLLTRIFSFLFLVVFFSQCNQTKIKESTQKDSIQTTQIIAPKTVCDSILPVELISSSSLKRWFAFYKNKHPTFNLTDFKFQKCSKEDSLLTRSGEPDKEYMNLYKSLFIYSPDSSKFIDIDSYNLLLERDKKGRLLGMGGDPETEVAVVNLKEKTNKRLLFLGPDYLIEDAAWIDQNNIVIAFLTNTIEKTNVSNLLTHIAAIPL